MEELEDRDDLNVNCLVDTDDLCVLLHSISRWRKIKSKTSTIVLSIKPDNSRFRLGLEVGPPINRMAAGWKRYDLAEFFPETRGGG